MIIDRFLSLISPHECLVCHREGYLLCDACEHAEDFHIASQCYRCYKLTKDFSVCNSCRSSTVLKKVWIVSTYNGVIKWFIERMKFDATPSVCKEAGRLMDSVVGVLPKDTVVVYVPTTPKRIRIRGFDQSRLIAKELAKRKKQIKGAFIVRDKSKRILNGSTVLLVDDVLTTGATIEEAALVLKEAGARKVYGVVLARAL